MVPERCSPACGDPHRRPPSSSPEPRRRTPRPADRGRPVRARWVSTVAAAVLLTTTSACGSGSGSGGSTPAGAAPGLEKTVVKVRVLPAADVAPLYLAMKRGYFAAAGLTVKPEVVQAATDAIRAQQRGSLDVVYSNYVSFFLAASRGSRLRLVCDGYQSRAGMTAVAVLPGTPIRRISDLAGRRIGISTLRNLAELTTKSVLETNGVNPASVSFVRVDNANMVTALKNGLIDAAYEMEPFLTQDQQKYGIRKIFDSMQGPTADLAVGGYATTEAWARANPRTFAAFAHALRRGQAAAADRAAVEAILPTFTAIDPKTASVINPGSYPTTLSRVRLQRVTHLMVTYGLLPGEDKAGLDTMLSTQ